MDWQPFILSVKLATLATGLLLPIMILAAWWISFGGPWKVAIRALLTLPMVLPPTVMGFYLLSALSPTSIVGGLIERIFNLRLVFSFPGMLIATLIISIPFLLNPLLSGFESLPRSLTEAASVLGKNRWTILVRVQLPNMIPSILTACVLTFAHALGEFGVILMIGGKIPGKTLVASMAVYDLVETMDYSGALRYSLVLTGAAFAVLASITYLERRSRRTV